MPLFLYVAPFAIRQNIYPSDMHAVAINLTGSTGKPQPRKPSEDRSAGRNLRTSAGRNEKLGLRAVQ
jgi:hypothetical protein